MLPQLTKATYEDFTRRNRVAIVDFWAEWCGPCQIMGPMLDSLAEEMVGDVAFAGVEVDTETDLAESQSIMSIPTLIIYVGGIEADRIIGMRSKSALRNIIDNYTL